VDVAAGPRDELWVADYRDSSITVLRPSGRGFRRVRRIAAPGGPNRLAVGGDGRIWAAMWDSGELEAWDPGRAGSSPAVAVRAPELRQPTGLGFDARGWLWVTTQRGPWLLGFAPAGLRRGGRVRPARRLALPGGTGALSEDVAFDAAGRAYVVQYRANRLVVLARPGSGAPPRTIALPGAGPVGARRGPDGAIWVVSATAASLTRVTDGGRRRRTVTADGLNMPHSISFIGGSAYVTDPTSWLAAYRPGDLRSDGARPRLVAHR
jgi:streptogramin lyase